mgnify:CR=1 FL=1
MMVSENDFCNFIFDNKVELGLNNIEVRDLLKSFRESPKHFFLTYEGKFICIVTVEERDGCLEVVKIVHA